MTNGEKYKTAEERINAFERYHKAENSHCDVCPSHKARCLGSKTAKGYLCYQSWLDLEVEEEKPMNCPFCGGNELRKVSDIEGYVGIECICNYQTQGYKTYAEAIAAHNRICKAVAAYKENEVK